MQPGERREAFRTAVEDALERDDPIELMDVALDIALEAGERESFAAVAGR